MEHTRRTPKSARMALLMGLLSLIIFVSALVFELDAHWFDTFLMGTCFFSLAGFFVGIYSLFLKRSSRGLAAVVLSTIIMMVFVALVLLFQDMCVIC